MPRRILLTILAAPLFALGQVVHEPVMLDLGISDGDYAPFPVEGGFIMSSLRESAGMVNIRSADSEKPLADIYFVPYKDGQAGNAVLFSAEISTPVNEGPAALTQNGTQICYTRNLGVPRKLGALKGASGQLGLFFSEKIDGMWQAPLPFQHNDPAFAIMHPTFSADGNTLYFASDMPGGLGGFDLYKSERTSNGWSTPQSLGEAVNSQQNEVFPRMQQNGILYFSSDRIGGLGGLDIYSTRSNGGNWSLPEQLPGPINSSANDVGLTLMDDGFDGIMSSDRTGTDKIHHIRYTRSRFQECTPQVADNFCYAFKGRKHAATNSLPLEHVWDMGDGTRLKGNNVNHCYQKPGIYEIRSLLVDKKTGSTFHVISVNDLEVQRRVQAFIAVPDTVRTGRQVAFDPGLSNVSGSIARYHWDMGDGVQRTIPRVIHQFKQAGVYEVKLDIHSVPDRDGNISSFCSTRKIIVIDRYREHEDQTVVAVYQDAFGNQRSFEYQELPSDDHALAFADNADVTFSVTLFASNERVSLDDPRFTEVKKFYRVVERYDPLKSVYTYSVGETSDLAELYAVFQQVKELQFLDAEVFALEVEKLVDLSQLDLASLEELNNTKLRTSAIHFAFNSAEIEQGSEHVLEQVLGLLRQHPKLQLVIEAHTDDIGSLQANVELSQLRATNVVAHLVAQGVDAARLVPIGHGENQPIASNKTEEGRSRNRRVEFRMIVKTELPALVDVKK